MCGRYNSLDLQKNLVLPKTDVGQEYKSRQFYLHNLAIGIHDTEPVCRKCVLLMLIGVTVG